MACLVTATHHRVVAQFFNRSSRTHQRRIATAKRKQAGASPRGVSSFGSILFDFAGATSFPSRCWYAMLRRLLSKKFNCPQYVFDGRQPWRQMAGVVQPHHPRGRKWSLHDRKPERRDWRKFHPFLPTSGAKLQLGRCHLGVYGINTCAEFADGPMTFSDVKLW